MALAKRIIPCLDIKDGRTVKGVQFEKLCDMGDPVELGAYYARQNADELVFLDITATNEKRKTLSKLVERIAKNLDIPFTVGGGISCIEDVYALLNAGADKVSINTAAYKDSGLISEVAKRFGSQCIVLAIDTKYENDDWFVYLNGSRIGTTTKTTDWVKIATDNGAGEILLTSINNDGTKTGFAVELTKKISATTSVPVIASGGAGNMQDFVSVFNSGGADAALAAGIFHSKEINIPELKQFLKQNNIDTRI